MRWKQNIRSHLFKRLQKRKISGESANSNSIDVEFSDIKDNKPNVVTVTLNGIEKTISFNNGNSLMETKANFLSSVNSAFRGSTSTTFMFKDGTNELITISPAGNNVSHTFSISYKGLDGVAKKKANKISVNDKIENAAFGKAIEGDKFKFSINDVSFEFSKTDKISDVMQKAVNQIKERYEKQTARLWDTYSKLETYIARMNEQSATLFPSQY